MVGYLSLFPRLSIKKKINKAQKKVDGLSSVAVEQNQYSSFDLFISNDLYKYHF